MVLLYYGKAFIKVVIAATERNGNFGDEANGIGYLMPLLIYIRKYPQPAGTVQGHA
jgi:hypothetical protein